METYATRQTLIYAQATTAQPTPATNNQNNKTKPARESKCTAPESGAEHAGQTEMRPTRGPR